MNEQIEVDFTISISELMDSHKHYESWVDLFQEKVQEKEPEKDLTYLQILDYEVVGHDGGDITIRVCGMIEEPF